MEHRLSHTTELSEIQSYRLFGFSSSTFGLSRHISLFRKFDLTTPCLNQRREDVMSGATHCKANQLHRTTCTNLLSSHGSHCLSSFPFIDKTSAILFSRFIPRQP